MKLFAFGLFLAIPLLLIALTMENTTTPAQETSIPTAVPPGMELATFGNGCFWCTEAVFQDIKGVSKVQSGYSGGQVANPTYKQVCTGTTGHAEVLQITYDPKVVSYVTLLQVFFKTHDPTTLNRQGNDVGTQYRSAIFYHNAEQQRLAQAAIKKLSDEKAYPDPIVTEVVPFKVFYKAEDYHQNYFNEHGEEPYCRFVIQPKVEKFKKAFADLLKEQK